MKLPLALLLTLSCAASALAQSEGTALPVKNPGFEEPSTVMAEPPPNQKGRITGSIADGWSDSSDWADVTGVYALDPENPHGGQTSQRIDVTRVKEGAVQMTQRVDLQANHQYTLHVWMRGTPGDTISLQLRQIDSPWTSYALGEAKLTDDWQEYTISGMVPTDGPAFILFLANKPTTFWVDDVELNDLTN